MKGGRYTNGSAAAAGAGSRRASIVRQDNGDSGSRVPTPDQPLLGGEFSHSGSGDYGRGSSTSLSPDIISASSSNRRLSSTSGTDLTEFERGWNRRQRGYQLLAL
ncbi:hypothetical protein IW150_004588, partial [Coemansia sp. RSA 2607]